MVKAFVVITEDRLPILPAKMACAIMWSGLLPKIIAVIFGLAQAMEFADTTENPSLTLSLPIPARSRVHNIKPDAFGSAMEMGSAATMENP